MDPLERPPPRVTDASRRNVTQYVAAALLIALIAAMFLRVALGSGHEPGPADVDAPPIVAQPQSAG